MTSRARPNQPPSTPPAPEAEPRPGNGEPMAVEVIAVADLHIDPGNVRKHPARSITDIKASLARFGQQKPVVIDANNVVRAGNGTLEAARELGWPTLRCVRTGLSGTDATAYSIADNKSALSAEWDDDALARTLHALQDEDFDLGAVGFTDAEVDALFGTEGGEVVDDPQAEWKGMPEFEHEDLTSQFQVIVHFANEADMRSFEELVGQKIPTNTRSIWHPKAERQTVKGSGYVSDEP
jgi:hypothetical protein